MSCPVSIEHPVLCRLLRPAVLLHLAAPKITQNGGQTWARVGRLPISPQKGLECLLLSLLIQIDHMSAVLSRSDLLKLLKDFCITKRARLQNTRPLTVGL